MKNKKKVICILSISLLAIALLCICIYMLFPKYEFKLLQSKFYGTSRDMYKFSIYGNRMMIVTEGYIKPLSCSTAENIEDECLRKETIEKELFEREKQFHFDLIKSFHVTFLGEEEYKQVVELFDKVEINHQIYINTNSVELSTDHRVFWRSIFKVNDALFDVVFHWDEYWAGDPNLFNAVKKVISLSPVPIKDVNNVPIQIFDIESAAYHSKSEPVDCTYNALDRIMFRVWPTRSGYGFPSGPIKDDWLDFILWEMFPIDEETVEDKFYF